METIATNSALALVVLGLAVGRIGRMLAYVDESGPWNVLHKVRSWSGAYYNAHNELVADNEFAKMVTCIYCNTVWLGLLATLGYLVAPGLTLVLATPFALSGLALLLAKY